MNKTQSKIDKIIDFLFKPFDMDAQYVINEILTPAINGAIENVLKQLNKGV